MLSISSSEITAQYLLGKNNLTVRASDSRMESKTVGTYLVAILLALTLRYRLLISKELTLTVPYTVSYLVCFPRSIVCKKSKWNFSFLLPKQNQLIV